MESSEAREVFSLEISEYSPIIDEKLLSLIPSEISVRERICSLSQNASPV